MHVHILNIESMKQMKKIGILGGRPSQPPPPQLTPLFIAFLRDVMKSQNWPYVHILACRYARKMIFSWFFRSLSSKMLMIFHLCDAMASWRHVMTPLNLIYLSQLVDVLESWLFFCFQSFSVTGFKNVIDFSSVWCRDVINVMSWRHKNCFTYLRLWIC